MLDGVHHRPKALRMPDGSLAPDPVGFMTNLVLLYHQEKTSHLRTQALIDSRMVTLTQVGLKKFQDLGTQLAKWESERDAAGGRIPMLLTY